LNITVKLAWCLTGMGLIILLMHRDVSAAASVLLTVCHWHEFDSMFPCPAATYSVEASPAGTMEVIGGGLVEPLVSRKHCASCAYQLNRLQAG
jgi:hypothetical protein